MTTHRTVKAKQDRSKSTNIMFAKDYNGASFRGRSTLNPNAPPFVPVAFCQVEDFSPEWWQLITTSTWYRKYWLSQHQGEDGFYNNAEDDFDGNDIADLLPDTFDLVAGEDLSGMDHQFEEFVQSYETKLENRSAPLPSNAGDAQTLLKNLSLLQSSSNLL